MGNLVVTASDLTSIYEKYEPAVKNLFHITVLAPGGDFSSPSKTLNNLAEFLAFKVLFNGESLELTRNKATKNFQVFSDIPYKRTDIVSITWRETKDWDVKKYHENWMNLFYDRKEDKFKSTKDPSTLYRTFKIILPSSKNSQAIKLINVQPKNIGALNLEWGNTSGIITHTLDYYVEDWEWVNE